MFLQGCAVTIVYCTVVITVCMLNAKSCSSILWFKIHSISETRFSSYTQLYIMGIHFDFFTTEAYLSCEDVISVLNNGI